MHSAAAASSSLMRGARDPKHPKVFITNPKIFEEKRKSFVQGGISKLQVVTDFDKTLTPVFHNGRLAATSYAIIEQREKHTMSERFHKTATDLYQKYFPIEHNMNMPMEEKTKHMVDWWNAANENLIQERIPLAKIPQFVQTSNVALRGRTPELFALLKKHNVPVLIFSAGLGDVLTEMLKSQHVSVTDNVHVISNFVETDSNGIIAAFKGPMIHVFNKNEYVVKTTPYASQIQARRNVLLMGDSIGDLGMSKGLEHDTVINVGFLNEDVEHRLETYCNSFDVLVFEDGGFDWVIDLLHSVIENK